MFVRVRWFWDLTCDFWAEFEEKKCKNKKRQQIPRSTSLRTGRFGDESKKGDFGGGGELGALFVV